LETVESIKQKYIKFRGTEEKEYTRNFPKPPYVEKFYEKPLDPVIFAVLTARLEDIRHRGYTRVSLKGTTLCWVRCLKGIKGQA
jgi:hypothetical protein